MTPFKILIVDDEPFNVDYLEQELEDSAYETIEAFNGQEALEKVETESPDLVLLDIMMPVMNGFEVLTRLKSETETRDIPVIIISASNDIQSVVRGIQLGAEDYLPKPFEPTLLHARISSCLEKKRLRDLQQVYLKSLERELEIGRNIQASFLPIELPGIDGWEIAAHFKAAREVAGDFYDAFLLPDNNLLGVVGDVCDKGVGAALFMTLFRSLIRATAMSDFSLNNNYVESLTPQQRLKHIISFTNDYISKTHREAGMFATIFIGIFDLAKSTLTYMNCGHEPPFWVKEGGRFEELMPTGPMVGIMPEAEFSVKEIQLVKDHLILAFSDGVPDAINVADEFFGKDRLREVLEHSPNHPAGLIKEIETHLHQFMGTADQFDDITMLSVKRCT